MSKSREQLNDYLKGIDLTGRKVLDVGVQDKPTSRLCTGTPAAYWTLDIDPQWPADIIGDLNDPNLTLRESFIGKHPDLVFAIEVLEHCWNPVQALKNIHDMLTFGGEAIISTPFINPHHDVVDYLRYTDEWYTDVLPKIGFEVVELKERVATTGRTQLKIFYQAEGMKISKIRGIDFNSYTYPIGYIVRARKQSND